MNKQAREKKRKAESQDVEQEEYYRIQPGKDYHSKKFNMTAKNYRVQFNNTLDNVDLLQSQNRTYDIFDHLIKDVTPRDEFNRPGTVRIKFESTPIPHITTFFVLCRN